MKKKETMPKTNRNEKPVYKWANPGKVLDRNGRCVNTTGQVWKLHNDLQRDWVNLGILKCAADLKDAIQAYLAHVIEAQSPGSAFSVFEKIKTSFDSLAPGTSISDLSFGVLQDVLAELRSRGLEWRFAEVRRFYRWCCWQKIPGFRSEIEDALDRLRVPANVTGQAVITRDINRGPLTDHEHTLVLNAVNQEKGSLQARVIIMILMETGARPGQLILLTEDDYQVTQTDSEDVTFYSLEIPRLKQRTARVRETKRRRISARLAQALEQLIKDHRALHSAQENSSPLFCWTCNDQKHVPRKMQRGGITRIVKRYPASAGIISPRTGKALKLFPYRFRYSFGTRLANQGAPVAVVAELLDHSNKSSARIYTASTSNLVDRLNQALGKSEEYAELMGYFAGEIISQNGNPQSVIQGSTPTLKNLGGIGSCGANYLCNLMPPLSCYVCPKFQAWTDGPHEEMLGELERFIEQLVMGSNGPSDRVPYQLSSVVTAIRELLEILKAKKDIR